LRFVGTNYFYTTNEPRLAGKTPRKEGLFFPSLFPVLPHWANFWRTYGAEEMNWTEIEHSDKKWRRNYSKQVAAKSSFGVSRPAFSLVAPVFRPAGLAFQWHRHSSLP
jgi:hypothetical protein